MCNPNNKVEPKLSKYQLLRNKIEQLIRVKQKQTSIIYTSELKNILWEVEND